MIILLIAMFVVIRMLGRDFAKVTVLLFIGYALLQM